MAKQWESLDISKPSPRVAEFVEFLKKNLIGQDRVIEALGRAIEIWYAGLKDPEKPVCSCLFLGPSGTGKTFSFSLLAKYFLGQRNAFTKIECGSYSQPHQVAQLLGSPPGYVGYVDTDRQHGNRRGAQPLLSAWNVYKHHYLALRLIHEDDIRSFNRRVANHKIAGDQRGKEAAKEAKKIETRLNEIEKQLATTKDQRNINRLESEHSELVDALKKLRDDWEKDKQASDESLDKLKSDSAELSGRGWDYDDDEPRPYFGLVFFDEVEKADRTVWDFLLEMLHSGRSTLANGQTVDFRNCIIGMTGNIGSSEIMRIQSGGGLGFRQKSYTYQDQMIYEAVMERATKTLRPEFMGRLDFIEVFRPWSDAGIELLVDAEIVKLQNQLVGVDSDPFDFVESRIPRLDRPVICSAPVLLQVEDDVRKFLKEKTRRHIKWGSRRTQHELGHLVRRGLARAINSGQLKGGETVRVRIDPVSSSKDNPDIIFEKNKDTNGKTLIIVPEFKK